MDFDKWDFILTCVFGERERVKESQSTNQTDWIDSVN